MQMSRLPQLQLPNVSFKSIPAALHTSSLFHGVLLAYKEWNTTFRLQKSVSLEWLQEDLFGNTSRNQFLQVARKLVFDGKINNDSTYILVSTPLSFKKRCAKRSRKQDIPKVETSIRRSTCSTTKNDGYMHKYLPDTRLLL
jgi:hypothetical protein